MPLSLDDLSAKLFGMFKPDAPAAVLDTPVEEEAEEFNKEDLVTEAKEFVTKCDQNRKSFDRMWFRSILYYLGNQWISWDRGSRRWRERKVKKWVPKPVTNRYASSTAALCAAIQSTRVQPAAWPATNDHDDIASANVADKIVEVIKTEIDHEALAGDIAKWLTLNADCFVWCYYDKRDTSLGNITIPALQCLVCGASGTPEDFADACPACGALDEPQPIEDPSHPAAQKLPVGRLKVKALSPLQVYFNMDIIDPRERTKVCIAVSYEAQTVKDMYPEVADQIQPDTGSGQFASQYFMDALAYSTEESSYTVGGSGRREKVTLLRYMKLPTSEQPDGVQLVMTLDGVVCEVGPLESFDLKADGSKTHFLPIVQIGYERVPGRAYSKSPVFDLMSKQDQLNRIESLMELASMKGVNVSWLLPAGSSISNIAGEPAQIIRYTPTGTGGAKPEVVTVAPFHQSLIQLKEGYQSDFEELAGTFDAMKGNTPKGVSAGYAIQLLTERSYGRFGPVFNSWEQGWINIYSMCLRLFRTYATEPRFQKIKGAAGAWEINSFSNADLTGSVDFRMEGGSSKPRSKLAEQAIIEALFNMGIVNPQDPEQRFAVAQMFGMSEILGSSAEDERAAASEWQALLDWEPELDPFTGEPIEQDPMSKLPFPPGGPMVDQVFDNHMAHVMEHRKPVRTDIWKQLPPWKRLFWQSHQLDHLMAIQATQMMQGGGGPQKPKGDLHAGSKADEMPDKAANVNKGSEAAGSGGANQHGG